MPRWRRTNFVSSLNIPHRQKVHSISENALTIARQHKSSLQSSPVPNHPFANVLRLQQNANLTLHLITHQSGKLKP